MENETNTALIIGLGCLALIFLAMLLALITATSRRKILERERKLQEIEKEKQIELFRAVAKAEENQKFKIASNLHDEVIPVLAFRSRNLAAAILELDKKGVDVKYLIENVEALTEVSERIRDIAHDIIPRLFKSFGFVKSIEAFVKQINMNSGQTAEFHNKTGYEGDLPFSKDDQLILFRICLEILNNVSKHAEYDYLVVSLEHIEDDLAIKFAHNGHLITNDEITILRESGSGIGLKSMSSRALLLNARIDYYGDPGVSYIRVLIPIKK